LKDFYIDIYFNSLRTLVQNPHHLAAVTAQKKVVPSMLIGVILLKYGEIKLSKRNRTVTTNMSSSHPSVTGNSMEIVIQITGMRHSFR
jgi:hypothetical protein